MKNIWLTFSAASLILFCGCNKKFTASIYYIPFQVETYDSITIDNIESRAIYKNTINEKNKTLILSNMLSFSQRGTEFEKKRVRLYVKWSDGKKNVFVDSRGNVFNGEICYSLGVKQFDELKKFLLLNCSKKE